MSTKKEYNFKEDIGALAILTAIIWCCGLAFSFGVDKYFEWFGDRPNLLCEEGFHLSMVENNNMKCEDGVDCRYYLMCVKS